MSTILNKEELSTNVLRKCALEILEAGLEAVNTEKILRKKVKLENGILSVNNEFFNLQSFNHLIFIGIGKCALNGAKVMEEILGDYLAIGIAIDVRDPSESKLTKIKYFQGTHPLPSQQNVEATKEILKMVENLAEKDLVICLISGGGSALFDLPDEAATAKLGLPGETSLETILRITKELTAKGADIYELNRARKEMSQVKGDKFAKLCQPAQIISLIFSDVPGNDISIVASGPTVFEGAAEDNSLRSQDASHISLQEFPQLPINILLASNHDALVAMRSKAEETGFSSFVETEILSGNAAEVGKILAERELKPRTCILFGGETTVKIGENHGVGGRNQEMALSALPYMQADSVLVCAASDGYDNTDHAGAIADRQLFEKAKDLGINPEEFLNKSDSYNFFKKIGDGAIYTGKLGNNVSDLVILLYK